MAVLLSEVSEVLSEQGLPHKTWTREELAVVETTGVFEGTHFELIEGELIDKKGKKQPHVRGTRGAVIALEQIFGREQVIQESPVDVAPADNPRNEPEPDVTVLRRSYRSFESNPMPADIVLVVEVAETTLRQDLGPKARLYARAGIPEYWVLDVKNRRLHVFRQPSGGSYQQSFELGDHQSVSPLDKGAFLIAISSLLD